VTGAVLAAAVLLGAGVHLSVGFAVGLAVCVYLAGFIVADRLSRELLERCRKVEASFLVQCGGTISAGEPALLEATMRRLHELDLAKSAGAASPAQFEARWAEVYSSLERDHLPAATER
jgi:hypothetical protein